MRSWNEPNTPYQPWSSRDGYSKTIDNFLQVFQFLLLAWNLRLLSSPCYLFFPCLVFWGDLWRQDLLRLRWPINMSHAVSYAWKISCQAKAFSVNKACIMYSIVLLVLNRSPHLWVLNTPVIVKATFALDERFEVPWLQPSPFDAIITIRSFWS